MTTTRVFWVYDLDSGEAMDLPYGMEP